jgi:hypothetical protein
MIDRACDHGLRFNARVVNGLKKDPCGILPDAYEGIWKPFGTCLRSITKSETVHASTKDRVQKLADYKPANLP